MLPEKSIVSRARGRFPMLRRGNPCRQLQAFISRNQVDDSDLVDALCNARRRLYRSTNWICQLPHRGFSIKRATEDGHAPLRTFKLTVMRGRSHPNDTLSPRGCATVRS
jgi:hypothetical protein